MLVDALAVYRLVRLVARDGIMRPFRRTVIRAVADDKAPLWCAELIVCPWCLSIWIAVAALVVRARFPRLWRVAARVLAVSALVGLISEQLAPAASDDEG